MAVIRFGPGGLGPADEAIENLREYYRLGLRACEVEFTYRIYLDKNQAVEIGRIAKELNIILSIHAPYYVNLNSSEPEKVEASKQRILKCCEIGHYLGARKIVFHPGFVGKFTWEESFQNIKNRVIEMKEEIDKNKWDVELCPETMGKINVFGSLEDISRLVNETGCSFCVDFAHILARYNENKFDEIKKAFPQKNWHCHFSGIEYGEKGERKHILTSEEDFEKLFDFLRTLDKEIVIINESPDCVGDSIKGEQLYSRL